MEVLMKAYVILILTMALMFPLAGQAGEAVFTIDEVHSSVQFKVRHLYSILVGRFNKFSGEMVVDLEKKEMIKVEAEVDILSVFTANEAREKHLLNPDFFDSTKFPKATFKSTKIAKGKGDEGTVTGELTIRGTKKEVVFKGKFLGSGIDHKGGRRAGFNAVAVIDRRDFGVSYNRTLPNGKTVLGDEVELELNLEVIEVPAGQAETK